MNRTNTGANTDTEQILVDIFVMAIAFGIDLLLFKNMIGAGELPGLIIVVITFITINILANKGEYLYNVTLFNYLDRNLSCMYKLLYYHLLLHCCFYIYR